MFAAMLATAIALLVLAVGRHAHKAELATGEPPAALYWLYFLVFPFGGAVIYFRADYPFLDALASDLAGMLMAGGLIYYGIETVRPLWRARQRNR